jgi:two-component system, OmpR family, sensor kinase
MDGRSRVVIRSLRTRLFFGLAALLVVTCVSAGVWAFNWSFDEAIELQDAILLQVGTLALQNHVEGELPPQASVDAEATIVISDIPNKPAQAARDTGFNIPPDTTDGLHTLGGRDGSWRVLLRTRSDGSRVAIAQPTAARDEFARDSAYELSFPCWQSYPVSCLLSQV